MGPVDAILVASDLLVRTAVTERYSTSGLAMAGPRSAVLTVTDVRYNKLDTESATALAAIAKEKGISLCGIKPDQTTADFRPSQNGGNFMQPADAILLTADLEVNEALTSLNLQENDLGVDGGKAIAEALKLNKALTILNLFGNEIGSKGAVAIAKALEVNKVLRSIDLSLNQLCGLNKYGQGTYDPSGIQALAAALSSGSAVLKKLNLTYNYLGEAEQTVRDAAHSGLELKL